MLRCKVKGSDASEVDLTEVCPKLESSILEDITVRTCFVTTLVRARQLIESRTNEAGPAPTTPPLAINYPLSSSRNLILEGSVRDECTEILFEIDNDMISLASMVLDAILQCPINCRVPLEEVHRFCGWNIHDSGS
jgi:actin-related protein 10